MSLTNVLLGIVGWEADGPYDPGKEYSKGKLVEFNGGSYLYKYPTASTGVPLTATSHWQRIASMGGQEMVDAAVAARDASINAKNIAVATLEQLMSALISNYEALGYVSHETFFDLLNTGCTVVVDKDVTIVCEHNEALTCPANLISFNGSKITLEAAGGTSYPLIQTKYNVLVDGVSVAGTGVFVQSSLGSDEVIDSIILRNCSFVGNRTTSLRVLYVLSDGVYDPSVTFYGVNRLEITNCNFKDIYESGGRIVYLYNVGWKTIIFEKNIAENFYPRLIDASTQNTHTYVDELKAAHGLFMARNNIITCTNDFKPYDLYTTQPLYYSVAVIESQDAIFEGNHVTGMHYIYKNSFSPNLYPAYLSCTNVTYKNNKFIDNMCFDDTKSYGDLFKSKEGSGMKRYENNQVLVRSALYNELGVSAYGVSADSMWVSVFGFQSNVDQVYFYDNIIEAPIFHNYFTQLGFISELCMKRNVLKFGKKRADRSMHIGVVTSTTKIIDISENYVQFGESASPFYLLNIRESPVDDVSVKIKGNVCGLVAQANLISVVSEVTALPTTRINISDNVMDGMASIASGINAGTLGLKQFIFDGNVT